MRNVYFTSFQRSHDLPNGVTRFSVAVQWPKGYEDIPRIAWALITDETGKWIRPREFVSDVHPLASYREALMEQYQERLPQAQAWLFNHPGDIAMLCWCPYDRAAQRQLGDFGTFVCHTGVLAEFVDAQLGCQVWLDADRRLMKALPA